MASLFLNTESFALLLKFLTEEQTISKLTEAAESLTHNITLTSDRIRDPKINL
jgi:hypothetical protein